MPVTVAELGTVRAELADKFVELRSLAWSQLGLVLEVPADGGTRTRSRQAALYADSIAQGGGTLAYPVATPGKSRHEYGAAFDVNITAGGAAAGGRGADSDYRQLADLARSIGLTAGYYFSSSDPYHFQLNESLADSQAQWSTVTRSRVATAIAIVAALAAAVALARR